jgi:hypothetical protein
LKTTKKTTVTTKTSVFLTTTTKVKTTNAKQSANAAAKKSWNANTAAKKPSSVTRLELDFLRNRNDDLERRLTAQEQRSFAGDLNAFDAAISQAAKEAEMADKVIAKAVAAGNGEDVTQAMRYRDQALARIQQLNSQKQSVQQRPPQQKQQIDDRTMHYAQEFMKENPWYDSQGRDEDSSIVIAIDQAMAKDGYDPRSEDYWTELRAVQHAGCLSGLAKHKPKNRALRVVVLRLVLVVSTRQQARAEKFT